MRLSFLAPDITRDILHGRAPADLTARKLMADTRAPIDWNEQLMRPADWGDRKAAEVSGGYQPVEVDRQGA